MNQKQKPPAWGAFFIVPTTAIQTFVMVLMLLLLYGGFLYNPLVFDDIYFFVSGNPEKYLDQGVQLHPRWWVYYSLGFTFVHFGHEMIWFRLGNLALHLGVGLVLFMFLRQLVTDLDGHREDRLSTSWATYLAAMMFVLHPVAVYGAGYLIQRTILMSTLFSLLSWWMLWLGLNGSRLKLWLAVIFYFLAVYSKEHAVMAPAVCLGLLILHKRSEFKTRITNTELTALFLAFNFIALLVILQLRGVIGEPYEIFASELIREKGVMVAPERAFVLSAITQAGLFFKYLLLWIIPNPLWMSVDMRAAFALSTNWQNIAILFLFFLYPFAAAILLRKGRTQGLVGLSMLTPWLLFATEISTVRIQEIIVLYRSYLWTPLLFLLVAIGLKRCSKQISVVIGALLCTALFAFSYDRLTSFSHSFLLWDEAAKLAERNVGKPGVTGIDRIYYNRGLALHSEGFAPNAIKDFDRALAIKPNDPHAYNSRGAAKLDSGDAIGALTDFETAIRLDPTQLKPYAGRAMALNNLGLHKEAREAHRKSCLMGWTGSCEYANNF